jgi:ABC-type bacteriocin/lantibiotic exporter with double-glycine peptidase domain
MKNYQEAKASHDTLEEIMKMPPAPIVENPTPLQIIDHISFDTVNFSYE